MSNLKYKSSLLQLRTVVRLRSTLALATSLVLAANLACTIDESTQSADDIAPNVNSAIPANNATNVALGGNLAVTFSEAMNPQSINSATVVLLLGSSPVDGSVGYDGVTATFRPTAPLASDAVYTARVTTGVTDVSGNNLASNYEWHFTTGSATDTLVPTISSTLPVNGATQVALGGDLVVTFSEAMSASTINTTTLTLKKGDVTIPGNVTYSGVTATFSPDEPLEDKTAYKARVAGAKDLAGNEVAAPFEWEFTTGVALDTTPPFVSGTDPSPMDINVALGGDIAVTFSEAMAALTITTSSIGLWQGTTPIPGTVTYNGVSATFNPSVTLASSTAYTATVNAMAQDLAGNAIMPDYAWTFTTGLEPDTSPPTVISAIPLAGSTTVAANERLRIEFSEAMDPGSLTTANFTLSGPGQNAVAGTLSYSGRALVFAPIAKLPLHTLFRASLGTSAKDLAGNQIAANYNWEFTTSTTPATGPAPVLLGSADNYVILAKTGIASVPTAKIVGNIGVSPVTSTAITGFALTLDASNRFATSAQITGEARASDYAQPTPANLTVAVADMEYAYTDAAGRLLPDFSELGAGEIGGMTLSPGLYKWGTGISIDDELTLDGGPNDVWIFQIAGDLTQASATDIKLIGGAMSKNVFWQSQGQFIVGAGAHFEGIALGQTAIVLGANASVTGRLLAQSAVTLESGVVTQPSSFVALTE
jgi:hypothetical protein